MRKNKGFSFIIKYEVYPFELFVSIAQKDKEFWTDIKKILLEEHVEGLKEMMKDQFSARTVFMSDPPNGGQTVMRLMGWQYHPKARGILQHEIFHAVAFLMMELNMPLCHENDEAYAYLVGYITEKIEEKIRENWK